MLRVYESSSFIFFQPLEAIVSHFYRRHPELHDHDVLRVYESSLRYVKAKLTNFPLRPHNLEGLSLEIYNLHLQFIKEKENSHSLLEIQQCLKTLEKSVKFWNKEHGSRGYLNFVSQFV